MRLKRLIAALFFLLTVSQSNSQVHLGIKFIGPTIHLKKSPHPHLYQRRLDRNGFLVLNVGIIVSFEVFLYKDMVSLKMVQGVLSDCAEHLAGFSHIGLRGTLAGKNHSISIGNGPTVFYRKDWRSLPGYVDEGIFKRKRGWQYVFFWHAGEVEYNSHINGNFTLSTTIIPGPPEFVALASGVRY
ncbi:MAG: hypothetical protein V3U24_04590 [Candidatus Neomarinimicrobiota bacterium]